jgi:hypothetical protein
MALSALPAFAQYSGGSGDGYTSSRSDDILYEGTTAILTGAELPDVVHHLTINNSAGVTLTKPITLTGVLSVLDGDFNLNGFVVTFGENATLIETPGNIIIGGGGNITVTRTLNDLSAGVNVGNLGLEIVTTAQLGETTIARGNVPQLLTPAKESRRRFFDVAPANDDSLNATVRFHYDASELENVPEADLALFISHDAAALQNQTVLGKGLATAATDTAPTWEFLGGTVNDAAKKIEKGGVGGFSRLTIARGFVLLAEKSVKIDRNVASEGDIHSNGDVEFEKGRPGTHTGDVTAFDDLEIEANNAIIGNAFAGDKLKLRGNASVSGTAAANAGIISFVLPAPDFSHGSQDVTIPSGGALHLAPGAYDDLEVKNGATLFLRSGDYFFDRLETDDAAVLSLDVAAGPVNINVVEKLEFDKEVEVAITPNGQAASNQVTFTTLQYHKLEIEERALVLGWIIAPRAEVRLEEDSRFKGSIVAKSIRVEDDVIFVSHAGTLPAASSKTLAKAGEAEAERGTPSNAASYHLEQNYPNPFNPSTTIAFSLKEAGEAHLTVYNLQGQVVRTLVARNLSAGQHRVVWDGKNDAQQLAPSGVYLYRLRVNGYVITKKLSFVK